MQHIRFILAVTIGAAFTLASCSKTDTGSSEPAAIAQGPKDTVTSFMVYFTHSSDSMTEFGSIDDPDGPGPKPAVIGGVALSKNSTYYVAISIEDASNPKQIVYLDNKIRSKGSEYKVCLSNPLGISIQALDTDGNFPIGLNNQLITTSTTGSSFITFTIKYQKDVKNGDCQPGEVYYTCKMPVTIY